MGIKLQSNFKWDKHIDTVAKKATQRLAMLRRILKTADTPTRRIAYFSLVRSILEYASQIWDPSEKKYAKKLEKIQNQALRFIFRIKGRVSFTELRANIKFDSLQKRRQTARFNLFTKCLASNIEPPFEYNMTKKEDVDKERGHYAIY